MLLQNKVALITGSSRGIGAATAEKFAAEGAFVIINYLVNTAAANDLVEKIKCSGGQAVAIQADVCNLENVHSMMATIKDEFNGLDIVVNNALKHYSFNPKIRKTAELIGWSNYQDQLDGSVKGTFNICHEALPLMTLQNWGRIINISSNLVKFPLIPYHDYVTAKAALIGYTRSLAAEVGHLGIQVNAIAPGLTYPTDSSTDTQNDVREKIIRMTPTGRLTIPTDIAGTATFLASNLANNVTGQCIYVDGGLVMQ